MLFLVPLIATLLVGGVLVWWFSRLTPGSINYSPCEGGWWEAELNGCHHGLAFIPQQPINSYTALMHVAGSLFLTGVLRIPPVYVFAAASIYLCVTTAVFHAVSSVRAHDFDKSAMYATCSSLPVYAVCGFLGLSGWPAAALMLVVAVGLAVWWGFLDQRWYELKVGLLVVGGFVLAFIRVIWAGYGAALPPLAVAVGLFAVGLICQRMDLARSFPFRRWGHGIWHVLTGIAIPLQFYGVHLTQ